MEEQRQDKGSVDNKVEEIVGNIKELVKKGNIARIVIRKGEDTILNLPLNAGIVGGLIGAVAAPWALVASAVATIGFDCTIELVKTDGTVVDTSGRDIGRKAVDMGSTVVGDIKDALHGKFSDGKQDVAEEDVVEEDAVEGDAAAEDVVEGDAAEEDAVEEDAAEEDVVEGGTAEEDAVREEDGDSPE